MVVKSARRRVDGVIHFSAQGVSAAVLTKFLALMQRNMRLQVLKM